MNSCGIQKIEIDDVSVPQCVLLCKTNRMSIPMSLLNDKADYVLVGE